jgi:alcohol dehydrogenase YqhD (iron-dependent ADH family)
MQSFYAKLGVQVSIRQFGVHEEDIPSLAQDVRRISFTNQDVLGCIPPLDVGEIENIYHISYDLGT